MDRLPAVARSARAFLLVAAIAACEGKAEPPTPTSRFDVAKTAPTNPAGVAGFCDVYFPGDKGPAFTAPAVVDGELKKATGWQWVNIWATWCKPCIEEMPRLGDWRLKLERAGMPVELAFVSVDESAEDLAAFRAAHPTLPPSPRLAVPAKQGDWYQALGLDGSPPIPIHVFVTPSGRVRCARAGRVGEKDFENVEQLLSER